jgi:hypothetical protein
MAKAAPSLHKIFKTLPFVRLPGDYSCHATADLAQFNPGYSHEIGWVQGNRPLEKAEFDSP